MSPSGSESEWKQNATVCRNDCGEVIKSYRARRVFTPTRTYSHNYYTCIRTLFAQHSHRIRNHREPFVRELYSIIIFAVIRRIAVYRHVLGVGTATLGGGAEDSIPDSDS